jgi:hypothetical protein
MSVEGGGAEGNDREVEVVLEARDELLPYDSRGILTRHEANRRSFTHAGKAEKDTKTKKHIPDR